MDPVSILYYSIIRPLELIYEFIFSVSYRVSGNAVFSIVILSITVGLLSLPLYNRADELSRRTAYIEKKLKPGKDRIKKAFKGDEQVLLLQAYYKENHYHPLMIMRSSFSLLLQIPFFIAAYRMLSAALVLQGTSFGPIEDLGAPDGMIRMGSIAVNLLPVLMTAINIISGTVYSKDMGLRAKLQLYITALVFLVLLYNSPSGLVLYWTLNNVFSLLKNIVSKIIPVKTSGQADKNQKNAGQDKVCNRIFVFYSISCSILIGLLIPGDLLVRSVGDFLTNYRTIDLITFELHSFLIALGVFFVWGGIYHLILRSRKISARVMTSVFFCAAFNYFAFYKRTGDMNRYLYIRTYVDIPMTEVIINFAVMVCIILLIHILYKYNFLNLFVLISVIALIATASYSVLYLNTIRKEQVRYSFTEDQREYPQITLSAEGRNVVVIMLDRAIGRYVPYIMNNNPGLAERFDGFTYYDNSLSYGRCTIIGSPAIFGGHEYTPEMINARSDELLVDKHNEALKVMPSIFADNGYYVTVCDPSYAGYTQIPDLSVFDDMRPQVNTYITSEVMNPYFDDMVDDWSSFFDRNLFVYGVELASPMFLRKGIYDIGFFNDTNRRVSGCSYSQVTEDMYHATGQHFDFLNAYYVIRDLDTITAVTDSVDGTGTFTLLVNNTTHEPSMLSYPDYEPSMVIDNSAYIGQIENEFSYNGVTLNIDTPERIEQFQSQTAVFLALADWFDYLRDIGIYDNTRIILVSDHGRADIGINGIELGETDPNPFMFNCLMMVKDFDETGYTVSDTFITNADTPYLALNGIIDDPVNPFTGNPIQNGIGQPDMHPHFYINEPNPPEGTTTYTPGLWYQYDAQSGDVLDSSAWEYIGFS